MAEKNIYQLLKEDAERLAGGYSAEVREFLAALDPAVNAYVFGRTTGNTVSEKFKAHLENGGRPSDFVKKLKMPDYIADEYTEKLYYMIDSVIDFQIGDGYLRRTFRAREYKFYYDKILKIIYSYRQISFSGIDVQALAKGNLPKELSSYLIHGPNCGYFLAAELDSGNTALEKTMEEVIFEDGGTIYPYFIKAIVLSKNTRLYEALGKLLLAARLQEGLRQAVCENMDAGRKEAFSYLFKVILDNKLLRFSAVKRGLWTWTGLFTEQIKDLDRITDKQAALIYDYLTDEGKRKEALKSEDSMELYIALWSYGATDVTKAAETAKEIAFNGSKHQRLTACFFLNILGSDIKLKYTSKAVVDKFRDELDTIALIFDRFMGGAYSIIWKALRETADRGERFIPNLKLYFTDESECRYFYNILKDMLSAFKGKAAVFEPCVFPWFTATLNRSDIVEKMAWCAAALDDDELIDEMADMLKDVVETRGSYSASRDSVLMLLLSDPYTEKQRTALIAALSNAETFTRRKAFELVQKLELNDGEYILLEDMLKYKKTDVRENIIHLLMAQGDDGRFASIQRLLSDKKEEKRTAALDMLIQLKKIDDSPRLTELAKSVAEPTAKEKILIDEILCEEKKDKKSGFGLYDPSAEYTPELEGEYTEECKALFMQCFPNSKAFKAKGLKGFIKENLLEKKSAVKYKDLEIAEKLRALIVKNENREYTPCWGEPRLLRDGMYRVYGKDDSRELPFMDLWREFYDKEIGNIYALLRLKMMFGQRSWKSAGFDGLAGELFGKEFENRPEDKPYNDHLSQIFSALFFEKRKSETFDQAKLAAAAVYYIAKENKDIVYEREYTDSWRKGQKYDVCVTEDYRFDGLLSSLREGVVNFPYNYALISKMDIDKEPRTDRFNAYSQQAGVTSVNMAQFIQACVNGIITKDLLFKFLLQPRVRKLTFESLSGFIQYIREKDRLDNDSRPQWLKNRGNYSIEQLLGHSVEESAETDEKYLALAEECYEKIIGCVLDAELSRGDTPTVFSPYIRHISRIYGAENFVKILNALGSEPLVRNGGYSYYSGDSSKRGTLSSLLKCCIPDPCSPENEINIIKASGISKKRLTEAAMYSTDWLETIGKVLGEEGFVSGCYYFIAHTNDVHSEMQKAMIAKYTPLTMDELNSGAFDVSWFKEVYALLGEKDFDNIYAAAKYISDGAKHSRARKYADAELGKFKKADTEKQIKDKRNKDLLMAYPLIPYKNEKDIKERYLFIQSFLKESKQFGAQRRASEKLACETAVKNMATMLGYPDETRLILTVEGGIAEDMKDLFVPAAADDIIAYIAVDETGKADIVCEKDGKTLKSVPARLKKNERINALKEAKKTLNDQRSRLIKMLESAMESESVFKHGELIKMFKSPVAKSCADRLVFKSGDKFGFFADFADMGDKEELLIAHPYHLYKAGVWRSWQEKLFGEKVKQPFKQVFRELYIKTAEENDCARSLRYSGNQINPQRTAACLKGRGWIADYENGLQKIYYKENIIAGIFALADWFSPSDIEEPTLEYVVFTDRKNFDEKKIKDIPDVVFSEVMRDVDLAVSVAHAGGVDPEMSHSTVEMRRAIAELTADMLALKNVQFTENHALIKGDRAEYSLHLGSGVVHIKGGAMLNILPVHSQQRGRIFLPFVDDDPKTAEILSKMIMLSEDKKIKDPYITSQIN